jgi:tellurite methyltransferase
MPSAQQRWNERYRAQAYPPALPSPWLVEHQPLLPRNGPLPITNYHLQSPSLAFDVAMGLGGSAGWLIERGWRVAGADISEVAVRRAKARWPALLAFVADLERIVLPPRAFDLILDFYYLDRTLWPQFRQALKSGGLLILETFVHAPGAAGPGINPAYVLQPGELRSAFGDWEVLAYREAERGGQAVASIVARS